MGKLGEAIGLLRQRSLELQGSESKELIHIQKALRILFDDTANREIHWTKEIKNCFKGNRKLRTAEVLDLMNLNPETEDRRRRYITMIYITMNRMVNRGLMESGITPGHKGKLWQLKR